MNDPTARPSQNENHLFINAYSTHPASPLLSVSRRIADSGCNLVDARLTTVGRDVSVAALAVIGRANRQWEQTQPHRDPDQDDEPNEPDDPDQPPLPGMPA